MVEGDKIFVEAIQFLKNLPPLKPLEWDENLCKSALEHVNDIGPKGLLLYQSSDGTEPEDRISKYGNYFDSLGENIDFGPNDAMGVIVSLTLDDGEKERPHRENLFKNNYQKIGIACGPHATEYQMCVMDFAFDFQPKENICQFPRKENNEEDVKKIKDLENQINELNKKLFEEKNKNENILVEKNKLFEMNKELNEKLENLNKKNEENENIIQNLKSKIFQYENDIIKFKK